MIRKFDQRYPPVRRFQPAPPQQTSSTLKYCLGGLFLVLVVAGIVGLVLGLILPRELQNGDEVAASICQPGYQKQNGGVNGACIDVDECYGFPPLCPANYQCQNAPGSYRCLPCGDGMIASPDRRRCYPVPPTPPVDVCDQPRICLEIHGSVCVLLGTTAGHRCLCLGDLVEDNGQCKARDPGDSNPCFKEGVCGHKLNSVCVSTRVVGVVECVCLSGYSEANSACLPTVPATNAPVTNICQTDRICSVNYECFVSGGPTGYTCVCKSGFIEVNGACQPDPRFSCAVEICLNGGKCEMTPNQAVCVCPASYFGEICQFAAFCSTNPCVHGVCHQAYDGYDCSCNYGWVGDICDIEVTDCASSPCNHGLCEPTDLGYECTCEDGYTGDRCDIDADDCSSRPCNLDHGSCVDGDRTYTCVCDDYWIGVSCDIHDCLGGGESCSDSASCCGTPGYYCNNCNVCAAGQTTCGGTP